MGVSHLPFVLQDKNINFQTISSPLGTQIPQAAGAAYALKHAGEKAVVGTLVSRTSCTGMDVAEVLRLLGVLVGRLLLWRRCCQ